MEVNKLGMDCGDFLAGKLGILAKLLEKSRAGESQSNWVRGLSDAAPDAQLHDKQMAVSPPPSPKGWTRFNITRLPAFDLRSYASWMETHSKDSQEQLQEELAMLHRDFPNLKREQLLEAKENLDRYFDLAVRIFLRLEREKTDKSFDSSSENF